jgi:hypothetical protein
MQTTRHDMLTIANRFEQTLCGHRTVSLRMDSSGDAHNIRLKEIKNRLIFPVLPSVPSGQLGS